MLTISRPTIRSDLSLLVMLDYISAKPNVGYFPGEKAEKEESETYILRRIKVGQVQGTPIVIDVKTTVQDAVVTLFLENIGSLMVTDETGKLAGVISRKDLLKVTLGNPNASSMPVSMVMTRQPNIVTITPEETVYEAARKMNEHQVDSLPVVSYTEHSSDSEFNVVGRITKTSIIKLLFDQMEQE